MIVFMSLYSNFVNIYYLSFLDFLNIKNTELNYHFVIEIKGRPKWIGNEKRQFSKDGTMYQW